MDCILMVIRLNNVIHRVKGVNTLLHIVHNVWMGMYLKMNKVINVFINHK